MLYSIKWGQGEKHPPAFPPHGPPHTTTYNVIHPKTTKYIEKMRAAGVTEPLYEAENEMILFHGTTPSYVFSFPDPPSPEMTQPRCVKYPPPNNTDNI